VLSLRVRFPNSFYIDNDGIGCCPDIDSFTGNGEICLATILVLILSIRTTIPLL
jgi:hypothetical protein